jgi:CRP-like cAMP-binding protein
LLLFDRYYKGTSDVVAFSISREDLANIVGTATESLIRTLSDFKEEKLIDIKEGKIFILNEKRLRYLKN